MELNLVSLLINTDADDNAKRTWENTSVDMNKTSIKEINNDLGGDVH